MPIEVTDPNILSQLNAPQPVTDPAILAQLEQPQKQTLGDKLMQTWPVRMAKDIYSGITLPGDVYSGKTQIPSLNGVPGSTSSTSDEVRMEPNAIATLLGANPSHTWSSPGHNSAFARSSSLGSIMPVGTLPSVMSTAPSTKQLIQTGGKQIQGAVESGAVIPSNKIQDAIETIRNQLPERRMAEDTHAALDALEQKTGPLTFKDFKQARDELLDVQANSAKSTGRTAAVDLRASTIAKHGLDDIIKGTPEGEQFITGNANVAGGKQAEALDKRLYRSELRSAAANSGKNIGNTIRQNVASMLLSRDARTMSPEAVQQAEKIVYGSPQENFMRHWGNYLGGGGGLGQSVATVGSGTLGFLASGGNPAIAGAAASAVPIVGSLLKHGANEAAISHLDTLSNMLRSNTPLGPSVTRGNYFSGAMPSETMMKAALIRALMAQQTQQQPKQP